MNKFIQKNGKKSKNIQAEKININDKQSILSKTHSDLEEKINNHPIKIYLGVAILAFGMGFSAKAGIEKASNQELVTKDSYKLLTDIEKNYVLKTQYSEEIQRYESEFLEYDKKINNLQNIIDNQKGYLELINRYDELIEERNLLENELSNLINLSNGINNTDLNTAHNEKKEELIRKIQSRDNQIETILKKIK